jgi:hypothetical protein
MKFEIHFEFRASLRKFQDLNFWDATYCILRALVQSISHPVNYNTQTLGKYISPQVMLIIKHQNLLS